MSIYFYNPTDLKAITVMNNVSSVTDMANNVLSYMKADLLYMNIIVALIGAIIPIAAFFDVLLDKNRKATKEGLYFRNDKRLYKHSKVYMLQFGQLDRNRLLIL